MLQARYRPHNAPALSPRHPDTGPRSTLRCQAGKCRAYFERYKVKRARHAGILLAPPLGDALIPDVSTAQLELYLQQELWAYTFGDPSPHAPAPAESNKQAPGASSRAAGPDAVDKQQSVSASAGGRGVVIPPPDLRSLSQPRPTPLLPLQYSPQTSQVHIFWDVASLHPATDDPRVITHRLSHLASCYGRVTGLYAYAIRKAWNWVPEHFLQYRAQQTDESNAVSLAGGGDSAMHRCPVCGVRRRTVAQLNAHILSVHPNSAAAVDISSAAPSGSTLGTRALQGNAEMVGTRGAAQPGQAAAAVKGLTLAKAGSTVYRNTSRITLGKVAEYHTGTGKVVVPPVGHQLSLKYCLQQEGWEARIVQNSAEAESVAIASGLERFLDRIRNGKAGVGPGEQLVVIVASQDYERLQQPLIRLRGIGGCATILVRLGGSDTEHETAGPSERGKDVGVGKGKGGSREGGVRGADLVLSWEDVCSGALTCAGGAPEA